MESTGVATLAASLATMRAVATTWPPVALTRLLSVKVNSSSFSAVASSTIGTTMVASVCPGVNRITPLRARKSSAVAVRTFAVA